MNKFTTAAAVIIVCIALVIFFLPAKDSIKIFSKVLDEKRTILVHLPEGYDSSDRHYPVLYHLDGGNTSIASWQKPYYTQAVETLEELQGSHVPEMILIGIANTDRARDMLPVKSDLYLSGGGADKFLGFIVRELIPFVDRNYRTSKTRILYGMSDSGLFAVYAFLEQPEVFSGYIVSSPSLNLCPKYIFKKTENLLAREKQLNNRLFFIYGEREMLKITRYVPLFAEKLRAAQQKNLQLWVKAVRGEGHIPLSSLYDGLNFVFAEMNEEGL